MEGENETGCVPYHLYLADRDPSSHPISLVVFATLYTCIFILGLLGNVTVIVATVKHRSLQTVQNIFILNLAASDIVMCMLIPLTPVTHIYKQWFFGRLCHIVAFTQAVGVFIATFSLCAISIDRCFRLVIAPGRALRRTGALRVTAGLWLFSLIVTLPYVWHMKIKTYEGFCGEFCTEEWPNDTSKRVYSCFVLLVQFIVPFSIMAVCYHTVFSFLRRRAQSRLVSIAQQTNMIYLLAATVGGDTHQQHDQLGHLIEQKRRVMAQKRRVTLILVCMVFIFFIAALPHNIVSVMVSFPFSIMEMIKLQAEFEQYELFTTENGTDLQYLVTLLSHCTLMLFTVTNPVLYGFLNPEFREMIMGRLRWTPFTTRSFQMTASTHL